MYSTQVMTYFTARPGIKYIKTKLEKIKQATRSSYSTQDVLRVRSRIRIDVAASVPADRFSPKKFILFSQTFMEA
jgi:hypothetical protein